MGVCGQYSATTTVTAIVIVGERWACEGRWGILTLPRLFDPPRNGLFPGQADGGSEGMLASRGHTAQTAPVRSEIRAELSWVLGVSMHLGPGASHPIHSGPLVRGVRAGSQGFLANIGTQCGQLLKSLAPP